MGMTAEQFWTHSQSGKAIVLMLAERNNPEIVREILDWLVKEFRVDIYNNAIHQRATANQAKLRADNLTETLFKEVESVNARNQREVATRIIDHCFEKYHRAGRPKYDAAMKWFADEIRKRWRDDKRA